MMKNNFMICGLTGWCMEIIFTSLDSIRNNNFKLTGHTSIWMFPIYGMAAVIPPVYKHIHKLPAIFRGSIYSAGIFVCEYLTGTFLKKKGHLSMGLQQCQNQYQRCHPLRLCASLDDGRSPI